MLEAVNERPPSSSSSLLLRQRHHRGAIFPVNGRHNNARDPRCRRPRHHSVAVIVKTVKVEMAVCVYHRYSVISNR